MSGAVRTDLILSAEIMVITLNEVIDEPFWSRLAILAVVAVVMTVLVYGAVALIVKMDDAGLRLSERSGAIATFGRGLVRAMPLVLTGLTVLGTAAMLWVGGHILLVGVDELGWSGLYDLVHGVEEDVAGLAGVGGFLAWLINTIASAILGLIVGCIVVGVLHLMPFGKKSGHGDEQGDEHKGAHVDATGGAAPTSPDPTRESTQTKE